MSHCSAPHGDATMPPTQDRGGMTKSAPPESEKVEKVEKVQHLE